MSGKPDHGIEKSLRRAHDIQLCVQDRLWEADSLERYVTLPSASLSAVSRTLTLNIRSTQSLTLTLTITLTRTLTLTLTLTCDRSPKRWEISAPVGFSRCS